MLTYQNSSQILVEVMSVKFLIRHKNTWAISLSVCKSEIGYLSWKKGRICQIPIILVIIIPTGPAYEVFSNQALRSIK